MSCIHEVWFYQFVMSPKRRVYACKKCLEYLHHVNKKLVIFKRSGMEKLHRGEPSQGYGWKKCVK